MVRLVQAFSSSRATATGSPRTTTSRRLLKLSKEETPRPLQTERGCLIFWSNHGSLIVPTRVPRPDVPPCAQAQVRLVPVCEAPSAKPFSFFSLTQQWGGCVRPEARSESLSRGGYCRKHHAPCWSDPCSAQLLRCGLKTLGSGSQGTSAPCTAAHGSQASRDRTMLLLKY